MLLEFDISDFRHLTAKALTFLPRGCHLISGLNGSGKTSFLEAIYYLSRGRSFRSSHANKIINYESPKFALVAHLLNPAEQIFTVGMERKRTGDLKIHVAGKEVHTLSEVAHHLPLQLIHSKSHYLLEGGPLFRRKYMDWGLFYLEPAFLNAWRSYHQVLKQRNAALRHYVPQPELSVWTEKLMQAGESLTQFRTQYVKELSPILMGMMSRILPQYNMTLSFHPGWPKAETWGKTLEESYPQDKQFGYTSTGPHRADLEIKINQLPAKDILSRGQQKLFVCAMIVAQGMLLKEAKNRQPIYLVDDLPSELDQVSRAHLLTLLTEQTAQIFITAIESEKLSHLLAGAVKMFHVEHGKIMEIT